MWWLFSVMDRDILYGVVPRFVRAVFVDGSVPSVTHGEGYDIRFKIMNVWCYPNVCFITVWVEQPGGCEFWA
jgi:hypothetical protein